VGAGQLGGAAGAGVVGCEIAVVAGAPSGGLVGWRPVGETVELEFDLAVVVVPLRAQPD
jgi:hypothetical protein